MREKMTNQTSVDMKKSKDERQKLKQDIKRFAEYENFTQDWIPFEKTYGGIYKTKDGRYVKAVEIEPITFLLRPPEERAAIINELYMWLKIAPNRLQFQMTTTYVDATRLIQRIEEVTKDEDNAYILNRREELIRHIREESSNVALSKKFYIIYQYEGSPIDGTYSTDERQIWQDMETVKNIMKSYFSKMGNTVVEHEKEAIFAGDLLYKALNPKSSREETFENRVQRIITDSVLQNTSNKKVNIQDISETYYVAQRGTDFTNYGYIIKDGIYESYLFVKKKGYRSVVLSGWFEEFTNFGEGVTVNMYAVKRPKSTTIDSASRAQRLARSRSRDSGRAEDDTEGLLNEADNAKFIKDRLSNAHEDAYDVFTMFTIQANRLSELKNKEAHIKTTLRSKDYFVTDCAPYNEQAAKMSLPLLDIDTKLFKKGKKLFLTSSLASTYMYTAFEVLDENGLVLGINGSNGSLFAPDPYKRSKYPNGNMIVLGTSGMGKTFLMMLLSYAIRITGKPVFMILPNKAHEWKKMVHMMGGEFIELAPGSPHCINIMAIRPEREIDKSMVEDYEEDNTPLLSKKIHQITTFIQLIMTKDTMTDEEEAEISTVLTKLYERFGITSDNSSIWVNEEERILKEMPIIEDFFDMARSNSILAKRIAVILNIFVNGDCKNMNGQTNVNLNNKMTCISVSKAGRRMLAAFSFLAVDCSYDTIKADRTEECALIIDEMWQIMINDYASEYIMEIYKIIRGYGGICIGGTQELEDVKKSKNSSGVISNAKIKFLLGTDKEQAKSIEEIMDITEEEIKTIQGLERGQALFISNGDKIPVLIKAPDVWEEFFTTDPKKLREIQARNIRKKLEKRKRMNTK